MDVPFNQLERLVITPEELVNLFGRPYLERRPALFIIRDQARIEGGVKRCPELIPDLPKRYTNTLTTYRNYRPLVQIFGVCTQDLLQ